MHDPMVVAHEIRRPWPSRSSANFDADKRWKIGGAFWRLAGRSYYFPPMVTIWHNEPDGADALTVCKYTGSWRWHVTHWSVQVRPLQSLRRWLFTRCEWCGGPSRKGDVVNLSHSWHRPPGPWWQGERGLFHADCSAIERAHSRCVCANGVYPNHTTEGGWGNCLKCGKFRSARTPADVDSPEDAANLILQQVPAGARDAAAVATVAALWVAYKLRKGQAA